ncbi:MAG: hypothetical protein IKU48_01590 [Clostridia bacterium]|nr:hypothetical protein [Clostridia bacterium]
MEKIIKLVFSCIGGIIVVKILGMCILGSVPAGDFGTIPIMLSLIVAYMFFVSCLSVWAYKKIRSIIGVNVTIFMLNIITGYMFYSQKKNFQKNLTSL